MRLRFHHPEAPTDRESGRLIFPRSALDQARRAATHARPPRTTSVSRALDAELDRMQRGLDTLREDVQHFKFPARPGDDEPPFAA
ncbi:MAG: hypothetical protein AB7K52_11620 [Phycisphaerales bacterium]